MTFKTQPLKKPIRISDDMYVANILRHEHGKVFFNARMYVSKYNIDIRSKDFDMMQIFDKFDLIDIRPMSHVEMLHVLASGNEVKINAMLINASYTNIGVPWIVDYKGKYYTDEVIILCLSYLNMMAFVSAKSIYEHKVNRQNVDQFKERRKLSRKELLDCVHVSDELINWFISFDVPSNILVMFRLFVNDTSLYEVRNILGQSLWDNIYVFRIILSIGAIRKNILLPMHFYVMSPMMFDVYDGKISVNNNLRVIK